MSLNPESVVLGGCSMSDDHPSFPSSLRRGSVFRASCMSKLPLSSIHHKSQNTIDCIAAAGVGPEDTAINFMSSLIPHIWGPKLAPFQGDVDGIEFVRLLGPEQGQTLSSGSIPHSRVFQVKIKGKNHVLKIVSRAKINEMILI